MDVIFRCGTEAVHLMSGPEMRGELFQKLSRRVDPIEVFEFRGQLKLREKFHFAGALLVACESPTPEPTPDPNATATAADTTDNGVSSAAAPRRIMPRLTVIAAMAATVLQLLAIAFHFSRGEGALTPLNFILLALILFILWGRSKKAPIAPRPTA